MNEIRAGNLRHKIKIQKRSTAQDEWKTTSPASWEDVVTIRGDIKHLSGLQTIKAEAATSVVKASIRIYWVNGISAGMRAIHSDQIYQIDAVLPGSNRRYIDLVCQLISGKKV